MTQLKTLLIDIESSPNIGYTWEKYEQNVIEFIKERHLLCFTAKWLGSNKVITYGLDDFEGYEKDMDSDKELCKELWKLLDEADVVMGHNSDKFDIKIINTRFAVNGLVPPSPFRTIDTVKIARKYFGFNSNKLNDLGQSLGLGTKLETGGFKLWLECMSGKKDSWKKMKAYNKQDVILLEKVYLRIRPWMTNHPNVLTTKEDCKCFTCGSKKVQKRGFNYTKSNKYQRWQCLSCGAWTQGPIQKEDG